MNTSESERSGAYVTGIAMTDILTYLYQDENALVAAMLYRSARKSIISLAEIEKKFGADISTLVKDTLAMGRSEEHTSELQSRFDLVCRLLLEKDNRVLLSA